MILLSEVFMKELRERLKNILTKQAKSDTDYAKDIGLNYATFKSYYYNQGYNVRPKTLRIIELYISSKENNV